MMISYVIRRHNWQAELPWEKRQVGNFVAKNTLDIFHVQTSEAKGSPNLVSQGRGSGEKLNNLVSFGLAYFCYGPLVCKPFHRPEG
jgi:hypothetical protein